MSMLRISLFGSVTIAHQDWSAEVKVTNSVQALMAYLLLHRHRYHRREVLVDLFWGDYTEERARSCLRTTLWRLRQVLEPPGIPQGTYLLTTSLGEIGFNCDSNYWLDVDHFEETVERVLKQPVDKLTTSNIQELDQALKYYTGELLEGFFENWVIQERERLRLMYLNGLASLMRYYQQQGAYEESIAYGRQILDHDPLREEIHREMIRSYMANGQRTLATRQYEACREILVTELGIPPMEETQALYNQIVPAARKYQMQSNFKSEPTKLKQVLRQLYLTLQSFDETRERLRYAVQLLEQLAEHQD